MLAPAGPPVVRAAGKVRDMTLRDDVLRQARERLESRSEEHIQRVFHMHKATLLDDDAAHHLGDLRTAASAGERTDRIHADIWARTLALLIGHYNLTLQIIREGGVPVNDERAHDYVAALNLITLQYGVWLSMYGDSRLNWLLVQDEDLRLEGVIGGGAPGHEQRFLYDVVLSFAGEDREPARDIADRLKQKNVRVFFDEDEAARNLGKDLTPHLSEIYRAKSQLCVVLSSAHYVAKPWTLLELEAAKTRARMSEVEYLINVKLDDAALPGVPDSIAYVDARRVPAQRIADMIVDKLNAFHPATTRRVGEGLWSTAPGTNDPR
jgi:hypothetical protein